MFLRKKRKKEDKMDPLQTKRSINKTVLLHKQHHLMPRWLSSFFVHSLDLINQILLLISYFSTIELSHPTYVCLWPYLQLLWTLVDSYYHINVLNYSYYYWSKHFSFFIPSFLTSFYIYYDIMIMIPEILTLLLFWQII